MKTKTHFRLYKKAVCEAKVNRKSLTEDEAEVTCGRCQDIIAGQEYIEKKILDRSFDQMTKDGYE